MRPGGSQGPSLDEELLYVNLCLLGVVSALRQENIELSRTAFQRSNNRALEHVLYRLYALIEGKARAQKDFKGNWPVVDKVQQGPFYTRIGEWTMELKKAGLLQPSVVLPVSALKTSTNERLAKLLLELSTLAIRRDMEAVRPGFTQALNLSSQGGLLEDSIVPGDIRLGIAVTRAKAACSDFLSISASASQTCDALEQDSQVLKRKYYEVQAQLRQQHAALATAAAAATVSPASVRGSPASSSQRSSSSIHVGPAAAASAQAAAPGVTELSPWPSGGGLAASDQEQQPQRSSHDQSLNILRSSHDQSLKILSDRLASLDAHLRDHLELAKALMADGRGGTSSSCRAGDGSGGVGAAVRGDFGHMSGGSKEQQQMLHPHQIDGAALAADAAAAAASQSSVRASAPEQQQRWQQQQRALMPCGPENIVGAVMAFSSMLGSLVPHVTQLAMVGDNAGPPPLLQPPSQPSSHAAHVAHQLQVHEHASRQMAQQSAELLQQAALHEPMLRELRKECSKVTAMTRTGASPSAYSTTQDDDLMGWGQQQQILLGFPPSIRSPFPSQVAAGAYTAAATAPGTDGVGAGGGLWLGAAAVAGLGAMPSPAAPAGGKAHFGPASPSASGIVGDDVAAFLARASRVIGTSSLTASMPAAAPAVSGTTSTTAAQIAGPAQSATALEQLASEALIMAKVRAATSARSGPGAYAAQQDSASTAHPAPAPGGWGQHSSPAAVFNGSSPSSPYAAAAGASSALQGLGMATSSTCAGGLWGIPTDAVIGSASGSAFGAAFGHTLDAAKLAASGISVSTAPAEVVATTSTGVGLSHLLESSSDGDDVNPMWQVESGAFGGSGSGHAFGEATVDASAGVAVGFGFGGSSSMAGGEREDSGDADVNDPDFRLLAADVDHIVRALAPGLAVPPATAAKAAGPAGDGGNAWGSGGGGTSHVTSSGFHTGFGAADLAATPSDGNAWGSFADRTVGARGDASSFAVAAFDLADGGGAGDDDVQMADMDTAVASTFSPSKAAAVAASCPSGGWPAAPGAMTGMAKGSGLSPRQRGIDQSLRQQPSGGERVVGSPAVSAGGSVPAVGADVLALMARFQAVSVQL